LIRPRVLLADDHVALLAAQRALLSPYFDVVGTAADGAALVSRALSLHPIFSGIDAVLKLRESGSRARIAILTVHREREFLEASLEAGALGYVQKSYMKHNLVLAIQAAHVCAKSFNCDSYSTARTTCELR
jgi:DNA-binding NarL/FixJ family response regulator